MIINAGFSPKMIVGAAQVRAYDDKGIYYLCKEFLCFNTVPLSSYALTCALLMGASYSAKRARRSCGATSQRRLIPAQAYPPLMRGMLLRYAMLYHLGPRCYDEPHTTHLLYTSHAKIIRHTECHVYIHTS